MKHFRSLMFKPKEISSITYYALFLIFIIVITLFLASAYMLTRYPEYLLEPYNLLIEYTQDKKVYLDRSETLNVFPIVDAYELHWEYIRDEAHNLYHVIVPSGTIEMPNNVGKEYLDREQNFWKGWKTIPLRMFNRDVDEIQKYCPVLSHLLKKSPFVLTAFFSILEPGKTLEPHRGPYRGYWRYQLALDIPSQHGPGECYLTVDGIRYDWEEGKSVMFDEYYVHSATNNTDKPRIVLFMDILRTNDNAILDFTNRVLIKLLEISPYNQRAIDKYQTYGKKLQNYVTQVNYSKQQEVISEELISKETVTQSETKQITHISKERAEKPRFKAFY